jgi:ribosome biogenesis GTPase
LPRKPSRSARPSSPKPISQPNNGMDPSGGAPDGTIPGIVIRAHGLWYEVSLLQGRRENEVVIATMRGGLKKQRRRTDIVAVGDRVHVIELPDNEAAIVAVEPRTRALVRTARHTRDTEQVILANPDQVAFVFALTDPEPHVRMLDRFIILAEKQHIPVGIVVNKTDLAGRDGVPNVGDIFGIYDGLYPVFPVSAYSGEGVDALRSFLHGKTTAVAGPSGVGKSSLLNAIDPENRRDVSAISEATGKGRHTTVGSRLYQIGDDTFVADTPGMRALAMHAVSLDDLERYYIEFRPFLGQCFYMDCTHTHEPDCAIKAAVERGDIRQERYDSYVSIRAGEEMKE